MVLLSGAHAVRVAWEEKGPRERLKRAAITSAAGGVGVLYIQMSMLGWTSASERVGVTIVAVTAVLHVPLLFAAIIVRLRGVR